tara:strand:+ start:63 stop:560 length:498 start_codon:yes stop_codon:yes gene_type:complete
LFLVILKKKLKKSEKKTSKVTALFPITKRNTFCGARKTGTNDIIGRTRLLPYQMDSFLRQLKIKTGVLRRLSKEQKMYEQEVVDLGKSSSSSGEEAKLTSQQVQCLEESKAMVRDTSVRLEKAFVDLEEMVENAAKEGFDGEDVAEKEEFLNAREMVERVKPSLT